MTTLTYNIFMDGEWIGEELGIEGATYSITEMCKNDKEYGEEHSYTIRPHELTYDDLCDIVRGDYICIGGGIKVYEEVLDDLVANYDDRLEETLEAIECRIDDCISDTEEVYLALQEYRIEIMRKIVAAYDEKKGAK